MSTYEVLGLPRQAIVILVAVLSTAMPVLAGDTLWVADPNSTGHWSDPNNWTNGVPTTNEYTNGYAHIDNGGTALVGTEAATAYYLYVGRYGSGTVTQTGSTLDVDERTYIADQAGTQGAYIFNGSEGDFFYTKWLIVGNAGNGHFVHTGGTVNVTQHDLYVGNSVSGTGVYEMSNDAEVYVSDSVRVGYEGTGLFRQTGGNMSSYYGLHLGYQVDGNGTYEMSQGDFRVVYETTDSMIGYLGHGIIDQSGGSMDLGERTFLGLQQGAGGTIQKSAGTLYSDEFYVGYHGIGSFIQSGGTTTIGTNFVIGAMSDGVGICEISGGTVDIGGNLALSEGGEGTLKIIGGGATIQAGGYAQSGDGKLVSELNPSGISTVEIAGAAQIDGIWEILDAEAPFGSFDILQAVGGISGDFDSVVLPGDDWQWGISGGNTLWLQHIPEPAALSLLALGGLAIMRRKRRG